MSTILGIDIETYSSVPLPKCGVYRYVDAPDFEILLLSYAFDDGPVITIDLACGEKLPVEVAAALDDPTVIKAAYNAQFERVCLSRYLGYWLDPHQWRCTAVMASYLTLPARLADVAVALKLTQQKMEEGKDLIRYFSVPCKPTKSNGGRTRNLPAEAPDKWAVYKQYNAQDVETERAVRKALEAWPLPEHEWEVYALDQIINDRGVRVDKRLVKNAIAVDEVFTEAACQRAKELTGLENPGSVAQLKAWLADQDMPMESLAKKIVQVKAAQAEGIVAELLSLRLELSKTSVKKYEAIARTVCQDGRIHGLLQFGGASRTFRWSGRSVQIQNLPQNHLPDLSLAREIVKAGDEEQLELTVGELVVKGADGHFYAVSVDDSGNVVSTLKQISNDDVADVSINAGEKIIEGTITAATLNVNDIFANNAIIRSLIAANLDVDTLFAREATLTALNAMDITGNTYLKLIVAGKAEQSALDALEERVSKAELKITADAIVSTVTGSETYMQAQQKIYDDMDALLGYRLEILAETVFLSENKRNTTLTAHVWHGNTEVTDSIAAERFKWARESEDATADAVWNSAHQGFKSILVTTADVLRQASFRCELTE